MKLKYRNETYCDMDGCSLIFYRFWQYNVDAKYLNRENLYKINKDEMNYIFVSF